MQFFYDIKSAFLYDINLLLFISNQLKRNLLVTTTKFKKIFAGERLFYF